MRKNKNKILLIMLVVLVAVFVVTKVFRTPALQSNLDTGGFAIDTSLIRSVSLHRPGNPGLVLTRNDSNWTVSEGEKRANAERYAVNGLMSTLAKIKPERIVSRNEDKWQTYQVDDSTSIHLTAYDQDNEPVVDWHVGRESQGMTYVRPAEEAEVYAMEGSLRNRMDDDFDAWRDKTFVRIKPASISKLTFQYPSDSGFVIQKSGTAWLIDGQKADSTQVQRYLYKLQSRNLNEFTDNFSPSRNPDISISVETTDARPVVIKAWKEDGDPWILNSTFQQGVYFRDSRIDDDLFVGKETLLHR